MLAFDIRSIILFRVCFGLYILYDILYTRLGLRFSPDVLFDPPIADFHTPWYSQASLTSNNTIAYLQAADTPHHSYPHQVWFYRGSTTFQYVLFTITCLMAVGYALGWLDRHTLHLNSTRHFGKHLIRKENSDSEEPGIVPSKAIMTASSYSLIPYSVLCKCLFWCLVTSYQNRNMFVHDGSDTYTRMLLLYSCFIPLSFPKHDYPSETRTQQPNTLTINLYSISSVSTTSLSLQIVFMYLGTVCCRTIDRMDFGSILSFNHPTNEWMLPSLSAVYNALCIGNFATRDNLLTRYICSHYVLCQLMTFSAMLIEFCCPILGLILLLRRAAIVRAGLFYPPKFKSNYIDSISSLNKLLFRCSILPLLLLHFGLLCCLRLPNWQSVAMIALFVWMPSALPVRIAKKNNNLLQMAFYKKTDGDPTIGQSTSVEIPVQYNFHQLTMRQSSGIVRWIQYFLFFYMIYNFCAERRLISKYDRGDIGEFFRISQYWVMYSMVGTTTHTTRITGTISSFPVHPVDDTETFNEIHSQDISFDVLRYVSSSGKELVFPVPILSNGNVSLASLRSTGSVMYPTVRWERALYTWSKDSYESQFLDSMKKEQFNRRVRFFGSALCQLVDEDLIFVQNNENVADLFPFRSWFTRKRQRRSHLLEWIVSCSSLLATDNSEVGIPQELDSSSLKLYLKEIEIRFQHLQVLNRQNVQIASPDYVMVVPCTAMTD